MITKKLKYLNLRFNFEIDGDENKEYGILHFNGASYNIEDPKSLNILFRDLLDRGNDLEYMSSQKTLFKLVNESVIPKEIFFKIKDFSDNSENRGKVKVRISL